MEKIIQGMLQVSITVCRLMRNYFLISNLFKSIIGISSMEKQVNNLKAYSPARDSMHKSRFGEILWKRSL